MRILNAGCGDDRYGTDFVDSYKGSRKDVVVCDLEKDRLPFKSGTFDEVYCRYVLSYLKNPQNLLRESYRVLKKGGRLKLIVPNAGFYGLITNNYHGAYDKSTGYRVRTYNIYTNYMVKNWLGGVQKVLHSNRLRSDQTP
ncbi:MAG: class I SAM-dependent methyltransferase [Candidatus Micrarchaeota archaeon]|nr:class I SAM-dependent methyltransferase [Candidatus Micrarchaeota archaeon]MDE1847564.1 class I SAM-dependent methyltransferase [Candidatus Micrarchaeota archaeon]MDE1864281.1 class I SAM-dependent methyltransferase [Candidatus Micrarchaeota archaeon]